MQLIIIIIYLIFVILISLYIYCVNINILKFKSKIMASRKRINHEYYSGEQRLSTKKEKQASNSPTCPPLTRKAKSICKNKPYENDDVKPISCIYECKLSNLYKSTNKLPYIKQVFRILDKIGEGSYAKVYKVCSKEDGKLYAIKVSKHRHSNIRLRYAEALRLEKLGNHPNIIKYFGAWEEREHVFIQLELYCTSLDKYAKVNHHICEEQLWDILIDMLLALKHLHDKNFVHFDLKPDNIMISKEGVYKLGDFGLLVNLIEHKAKESKSYTSSDGDSKYLAREVLEGSISTAADIFSLGITMLELATDLVLPSNGPLWHQMRNGILPEEYTKEVPTALLRIIKAMMANNYLSRPSVNLLLNVEPIKTKLAERNYTERINYHENWFTNNPESDQEQAPIVEIFLRLKPNTSDNSTSEHENSSILFSETEDDSATCVTPPRRVSQVVLYTV